MTAGRDIAAIRNVARSRLSVRILVARIALQLKTIIIGGTSIAQQ